ncbi:unnamed protein product [Cylicocyclus nassatus]|uniref:EB domain-containing protein n=1 Tax=Cylicocyclus nassatus TaxID=53992 RepID=A0AA36GF29_CYLNA|nr:unnamed protein product [Cylicocyclus nassatus]
MRGFCCKPYGVCGANEVSIANMCFTKSYIGGSCFHSTQCQPSGGECRNNVCVANVQSDTASFCLNPSQQPERINGIVKNCAYTPCSPGYKCLFNQAYGQYFCCGQSDSGYDYNYGKIRMYPGTLQPLQCFAKDQCLWVDTPNCVYSYRYRQYVCCSTFNC